jgi:hypothetical protein
MISFCNPEACSAGLIFSCVTKGCLGHFLCLQTRERGGGLVLKRMQFYIFAQSENHAKMGMVHAVSFFYKTWHFGIVKRTYLVILEFSWHSGRNENFRFRINFRENFFTKKAETLMMWTAFGIGHKFNNVYKSRHYWHYLKKKVDTKCAQKSKICGENKRFCSCAKTKISFNFKP